ncbi:MAG: penicillin-binding transpeptidase domain-containing protein [Bilophila wadsworthia]
MKKHIIIGTLFALVLLASVARASETVERTDLADIFQGFDGTFIMYDEGADRYTVFNKTLSETRLPPCSTFKVFHALIGLDSGVLDRDDARTLMKWNGKPSSIAAWNHDQTLASAMRHSVVWYFQRVATGIGEERMQRGLDRIGYGNRDISGGLTRFWLQSSLKISRANRSASCAHSSTAPCPSPPRTSPSSAGHHAVLGKGLRFMGKTGSGSDDADRGIIGWFVGGVETPHNRWSFAVNIQGLTPPACGPEASPKRRSNGSASCPSVPAPRKAVAPPPLNSYNSFRQFTRSPFPCHTREW